MTAGLARVGLDPVAPVRLLDGTLIILDLRGRTEGEAAWNGSYERRELAILKACTPSGGVLVDVGANVGLVALPMARHLATAGGRVIAIEPVAANISRLESSARLNNVEVETHAVALGDHQGTIQVTRETGMGATSGNAVVGEVGIGRGDTSDARLDTLDHLAESCGWSRLDTLKVDVEGYEIAFMRGAEAVLTRDRPLIVGEFNSDMMPKFGHTFLDVGHLCDRLGYRIVEVDETRRPVVVQAAVGRGNVVLVPQERLQDTMHILCSVSGLPADPSTT